MTGTRWNKAKYSGSHHSFFFFDGLRAGNRTVTGNCRNHTNSHPPKLDAGGCPFSVLCPRQNYRICIRHGHPPFRPSSSHDRCYLFCIKLLQSSLRQPPFCRPRRHAAIPLCGIALPKKLCKGRPDRPPLRCITGMFDKLSIGHKPLIITRHIFYYYLRLGHISSTVRNQGSSFHKTLKGEFRTHGLILIMPSF